LTRVFKVVRSLQLRPGYVLGAYQYRAQGNGNGFVWALPDGLVFPEPADCPRIEDVFLEPPKPPGACDDFMEAIQGDGTPESYLAASLLKRELAEFGAMWHGCDWGTHTILAANPLASPQSLLREQGFTDECIGPNEEWRWKVAEPAEWRPCVSLGKGGIQVVFYTFSGLGSQTIFKHVDRYREASYVSRVRVQTIAAGPSGYVF
jgi:hypothetical protein